MPEFPQTNTGFPTQRPRRLRHDDFSRRMVRENIVTADDLDRANARARWKQYTQLGYELIRHDLAKPVAV